MGVSGRIQLRPEGRWLCILLINTDNAHNRVRCLVKSVTLLPRVHTKKCPMGSNSGEEETDWMGGSRFKMTYGAKWFDWCQETPAIISPGTLSTVWLQSSEADCHPPGPNISLPASEPYALAAPSQLWNHFPGVCRV